MTTDGTKPIDLARELDDLGEDPCIPIDLPQGFEWEEASPIRHREEVQAVGVMEPTADIPQSRVRFTAPATVRLEGEQTSYEGAVVNLSESGVACLTDLDVEPGARLWLNFALGLGRSPLTLLCEVAWRHVADGDWLALGLHFKSLTDEEASEIEVAVRERTDGSAAAWPLPIVEDDASDEPLIIRPASNWLSAAAGMAAGIGIALLLSTLPTSGSAVSQTPGETALVSPVVKSPSQASALPQESADSPTQASADAKHETHIQKLATNLMPVQEQQVEPAVDQAALPRMEKKAHTESSRVLRPLGKHGEMTLALRADGPIDQHVAFWLSAPKRLVIDVPGRNSGFDAHNYTIKHPLASKLRVGEYKEKVRFVIETDEHVETTFDAVRDGNALVVTLRKG